MAQRAIREADEANDQQRSSRGAMAMQTDAHDNEFRSEQAASDEQQDQLTRIYTEDAMRRSLADAHGDENAAIARSIIDEAARQAEAAKRRTDGTTTESHRPQHTQRNGEHNRTQTTATATGTMQLVPRKTDESSSASLMTGDEQWPAENDGDATIHEPAPTTTPKDGHPAVGDVQTRPAKNSDETPPAKPQHIPAHFHPSKRATVDDESSRGSRDTTVSASQPFDTRPDGRWSAPQKTLNRSRAPR